MDRRHTSPIRVAAVLIAFGTFVGGTVAVLSVATAAPLCWPGSAGDECRALVSTLGRRAGVLAGVTTILMSLVAAGLLRMVAQDDRDRAQRAMDAYRLARERGFPDK